MPAPLCRLGRVVASLVLAGLTAAGAAEAVRGSVEAALDADGAAVLVPVLQVGPDPEVAALFASEIFARK